MRFILILICLLLTACSDIHLPSLLEPYKMDIRQGNAVTPEQRAQLQFGMSRKQVHLLLGTPLIQDPFHADRWDYYYSFAHQGKLVKQTRLTVYFKNDALVRIYDNGKVTEAPPPSKLPPPVTTPLPLLPGADSLPGMAPLPGMSTLPEGKQ